MNSTYDYIIKKYNIKVGRQYFVDVPEMKGSADLVKLFAELGFKHGAEIGTDQGEFAEVMLKAIPNLTLNCIDPWRAVAYSEAEQPESYEDQDFFDKRYKETVERLEPYSGAVIVRDASMDALEWYDDNSLDFVYIDGNHDFLNVIQDVQGWLKKVRPGGIIAGHDYVRYPFDRYNHVQRAVQAYAVSYHLLPIFSVAYTNKGLRRDRYRSWFYVKP